MLSQPLLQREEEDISLDKTLFPPEYHFMTKEGNVFPPEQFYTVCPLTTDNIIDLVDSIILETKEMIFGKNIEQCNVVKFEISLDFIKRMFDVNLFGLHEIARQVK